MVPAEGWALCWWPLRGGSSQGVTLWHCTQPARRGCVTRGDSCQVYRVGSLLAAIPALSWEEEEAGGGGGGSRAVLSTRRVWVRSGEGGSQRAVLELLCFPQHSSLSSTTATLPGWLHTPALSHQQLQLSLMGTDFNLPLIYHPSQPVTACTPLRCSWKSWPKAVCSCPWLSNSEHPYNILLWRPAGVNSAHCKPLRKYSLLICWNFGNVSVQLPLHCFIHATNIALKSHWKHLKTKNRERRKKNLGEGWNRFAACAPHYPVTEGGFVTAFICLHFCQDTWGNTLCSIFACSLPILCL